MVAVRVSMYDEQRVPRKPLGRHVEFDPRSWLHDITEGVEELAAGPVLWERYSPILDQGDLISQGIRIPGPDGQPLDELGSCTGNAITGWLGCAPHCTSAADAARFDEEFAIGVYRVATTLDKVPGSFPPDDTGSSGIAAAKAVKKAGLISGYGWAFTTAALVHALQSAPVIVGVPWLSGFDKPDARGFIHPTGYVRGGHEFLIRGYQPAENGQEAYFTADNSWSTSWGDRGSFRFTVATWETLRRQHADVTVPKP